MEFVMESLVFLPRGGFSHDFRLKEGGEAPGQASPPDSDWLIDAERHDFGKTKFAKLEKTGCSRNYGLPPLDVIFVT